MQVLDWAVADTAAQVAGKISSYYTPDVPASTATGDLWFDTSNGNRQYRAEAPGATAVAPGGWVAVPAGLGALAPAVTARALGAIKAFQSDTEPTGDLLVGDLWTDTSNNNWQYQWDGSDWISLTGSSGPTGSPALSPAFVVNVLFGTLSVRTDPIDVWTTLKYEVSTNATFTSIVLIVNARQTLVQLSPVPSATNLWVRVTAFNELGSAAPAAVSGPHQTLVIESVNVADFSLTVRKFQTSTHMLY
jgi:hypothetical protein